MPPEVEDRAADMWEPLLALADIAGGQWPKRAREAAAALVAVAREIEPSLNLRLLADLRMVFGKHDMHDALYTKTILAELHRLEDAPWGDIKGKPLSDNQLARRLRNYDVKPTDVRIDRVVLKGYRRTDLHDAWRRYLPPLPEEGATGATGATDQPFQGAERGGPESEPATDHPEPRHEEVDVAAAADIFAGCSGADEARNPHEMGTVAGVADVGAFSGQRGRRAGLELARHRSVGQGARGVGLRQARYGHRAGRAQGRNPPAAHGGRDISGSSRDRTRTGNGLPVRD